MRSIVGGYGASCMFSAYTCGSTSPSLEPKIIDLWLELHMKI